MFLESVKWGEFRDAYHVLIARHFGVNTCRTDNRLAAISFGNCLHMRKLYWTVIDQAIYDDLIIQQRTEIHQCPANAEFHGPCQAQPVDLIRLYPTLAQVTTVLNFVI